MLLLARQQKNVASVKVKVNDEVASYLNNQKRKDLARLEDESDFDIQILGSEFVFPEHLELECKDAAGHGVQLVAQKKGGRASAGRATGVRPAGSR